MSVKQELMKMESSFNNEYFRWGENKDRLAMQFSSQASVGSLAREAFSIEFIDFATFSTVTDHSKTFTETERADKLIQFLINGASTINPGPAKVFHDLLDSLQGRYFDPVRNSLGTWRKILCMLF